jgi:3-ketosteroid 9alpha-monooxygenase subunit B
MSGSSERDTVRRHSYHSLSVLDVVEETADTRTFVMDVPESLSDLYRYEPGQFCSVRTRIDGSDVIRCYSMSSAPVTDERLAVTVKRVPGGVVSNWLHDNIAAGDELELMPPAGVFCERDGDAGPIIAFCGGSGVTPVFSILKQALHSGTRTVSLFYANRDPESIIFGRELTELEVAHGDRLTVHHHLDSESGYVTAAEVAGFLEGATATAGLADAHVFICGPTPFMDLVEHGAIEAGIAAENIAIERFVNSTLGADVPAAEATPAETDADTTTLTITIKRKKHVLDHVAGDTVLDAARRATLNPPYSCEQGNCATCMALVKEGTVRMRVNNALTPAEVDEGWILTCQALPTSPTLAVVYDDL